MKSKKVIMIVAIVLLLAIAAGIVFFVVPQMQQKQADYAQAAAYLEEGNYRLAYKGFSALGNYKDAARRADMASQLMQEAAQKHIDKAQELADMGYNMLAGLYLTASLADEFRFSQEDYNKMAEMIGAFYESAQTMYDTAMAYDDKQTIIPMLEIWEGIEALAVNKDPSLALEIMGKLTSAPLVEQLVKSCIESGILDKIPLEEMAEMAPFWVPIIDQYLAAMDDLNILDLVGKQ